jgi:predicted nucleotidyltransferase
VSDARATLDQLRLELERHFGSDLVALYLFGSLVAGGFRPGRSDLDLIAVLEREVDAGEQFDLLKQLHDAFVAERPEWDGRIEVSYVSREVLATFAERPSGRVAVISPGEPLNIHDAGIDSILDWYSVCEYGETLLGPPPHELGPSVSREAYQEAVRARLADWQATVREPVTAYVPVRQAYIVLTLCRALYSLATGGQASKEEAADWAAASFPEWAPLIEQARTTYRTDPREVHRELIAFADQAAAEGRLSRGIEA